MKKLISKPALISGKLDNTIDFKNLSLMDDIWFSTSLDNNPSLASFILNIILDRNDLVVKKISTQKKLTNIKKRSVILDALAFDSNNKQYNIEIQKTYDTNIILRSRFHLSLLDSYNLKKSNDFNKLPETYIIFFCDFDLFKEGKECYIVERYINGKEQFNDLEHIIFVNCKCKNITTPIGKLIHDMTSKIGQEKCYNIFADNEKEGDYLMGEQCERIRQSGIQEGIQQGILLGEEKVKKLYEEKEITSIVAMLKEGLSIDLITKVTKKSKDEILEIKGKHKL